MVTYFSGFAGIGGFDEGIRRVLPDAECVGFSEVDKNAIKIYEKHFPDRINYGDITRINAKTLPDFHMFCGGFPCQDVSKSGKRAGLRGERSGLFFEIIRLLRKKKPELIFLENVEGLLSSNKGWDFARILIELADIGYVCEWDCLNSADYGVPQSRKRVFLIGHRKDIPFKPVFPLIDKNIGNENDNEKYGIEKVYRLSEGISENIRVLSLQRQGQELPSAEMSKLSERIYEELQTGASREVLNEWQTVRQNCKEGIPKVETVDQGAQSIDNTRGICRMVRLPTPEMLLLWDRRDGFAERKGCLQQLSISFINRQNRFIEGLHKGEYGSLLLAVQSYKGRLFYSVGDGRDWSKIYCTKMEEKTRTTLNSILEVNPDPKYFISEKMIKYLTNKRLKSGFSKMHTV